MARILYAIKWTWLDYYHMGFELSYDNFQLNLEIYDKGQFGCQ